MRIIGSRFQPSARSVPPDRFSPMVCAVSRELRYPVNSPFVMIGVHCAGNAFVVETERTKPRTVLLARICDHVHQVAAIAQRAQLVERQKRSAGEIRFHPQHAVEFDRMPDRFVNLQPQLRAIENDVELAFRTLIGMMQRHRLFGDPPGVFEQLQFIDQLISLVLPLPAIRIRIRPLLNLISRKRVRRIARAGRVLRLMNVRALRTKRTTALRD